MKNSKNNITKDPRLVESSGIINIMVANLNANALKDAETDRKSN